MFNKNQRSTFKYWFAHWSAYQMTALNLGIWKFKYLFHDIEKPWLLLWFKLFNTQEVAYVKVQKWHRYHNKHHLTYWTDRYFDKKFLKKLDFDAMIIDWECSRFTKSAAQKNARETLDMILDNLKSGKYNTMIDNYVIEPTDDDIAYIKSYIEARLQNMNL